MKISRRLAAGALGLAATLVAGATGAWAADPFAEPARGLVLERIAEGLAQPLYVTAPSGDPRIFVVEQPGRIRVIKSGRLLPQPFLDLTGRVRSGGERGLLSIAFHPRYARNGFLYVNYTDLHGDTRVERYSVTADPDRADPASGHLILTIGQPFSNHNGGHMLFGPDSMLYIATGDGGGAGDPYGNAQRLSSLLGKLLRIDVDRGDPYAIPRDNPFVGRDQARGEIWAYGLRNPWRFCFDRPAGMLYIADVGQNRWEEIDVEPARTPGLDYGWNVLEGNHCYRDGACDARGMVRPVVEYGHDNGCSITGGFVYRGRRMPALVGHYFYADYCSGWIRSFKLTGQSAGEPREWHVEVRSPTSFGEDAAGELYVCSHEGAVYRLGLAGR